MRTTIWLLFCCLIAVILGVTVRDEKAQDIAVFALQMVAILGLAMTITKDERKSPS